MYSSFWSEIRSRQRTPLSRIGFTDVDDPRIHKAVDKIISENIAFPIILGDVGQVNNVRANAGLQPLAQDHIIPFPVDQERQKLIRDVKITFRAGVNPEYFDAVFSITGKEPRKIGRVYRLVPFQKVEIHKFSGVEYYREGAP